jgi:HEAT repeat protein
MGAAMSLEQLGGLSEADVNALSAALTDPERAVRISVAQAIGSAGTAGRAAIPELKAALTDRDSGVRGAAAKAVKALKSTGHDSGHCAGR